MLWVHDQNTIDTYPEVQFDNRKSVCALSVMLDGIAPAKSPPLTASRFQKSSFKRYLNWLNTVKSVDIWVSSVSIKPQTHAHDSDQDLVPTASRNGK